MSGLTKKLASLGAHGRYPANMERDLFRVLKLPVDPYHVELPTRCQSNRQDVVLTRVPILLPHEMYHYLYDAWLSIMFPFCFFLFLILIKSSWCTVQS